MAWLWDSWEEFADFVHPTEAKPGWFNESRIGTRLEANGYIFKAVCDIENSIAGLKQLGFEGQRAKSDSDRTAAHSARNFVIVAINSGERLLLYHKRLALSRSSSGFLHQNDLLEHWDRYAKGGRIGFEMQQLLVDLQEFVRGYYELLEEDEHFLLDDLDLPDLLAQDFRLSRDLFSVGFDEPGLLLAGRGLEAVVRQIGVQRKIELATNKGKKTADEIDFHDLIEVISRLKWKASKKPLISREMKALLLYLKAIRNSGAHPGADGFGTQTARETANVVAKAATRLWLSTAKSRARIEPLIVQKSW